MAFVWSSLFIIAGAILLRRKSIVIYSYFYPLLFLTILSILRLIASFEMPFTKVIRSRVIYPKIMSFLDIILLSFRGFTLRVSTIFLTIWIAGIIIYWLRVASRQIRFRKYTLSLNEAKDQRINSLLTQITGQSKSKIKVILVPASYTASPILTGLFRPVIYLPDISFTDTELEYILRHELIHYLHKDLWIKILLNIVISIFWWNPLMQILKKDANHLLELKSDLILVRNLSEEMRTQYLEVLLKVAKEVSIRNQSNEALLVGIGFINSGKEAQIMQRFHLIDRYKPLDKLHDITNRCVCSIMIITYLISFLFILQSYTDHPPDFNKSELFTIEEDNSYLIDNKDGSYSLYSNGVYIIDIYDIANEPFSSLIIKNE
jgi:beta-lactamase regulating signal transducer with metallopeptidase domain